MTRKQIITPKLSMLMLTREGTTIVTQPEFPTITLSHFYSLSNDVAERRKRLKVIV